MADFNQHNQFGSPRSAQSPDPRHCARFDVMVTDAVDGTLSAEDQAAFDAHLLGCATCSASFAEAQKGLAWLEILRPSRPKPTADLVERILAQTSGAAGALSPAGLTEAGGAQGFEGSALSLRTMSIAGQGGLPGISQAELTGLPGGKVLPFRQRMAARFEPLRHTLLQPRLAMTAAMAFFSVAVTMSLTGVHVTELRASDLRPSSIKRSFYDANAHVVRYYENLRVVYELESRVHDLQRSAEVDSPENPAVAPAVAPEGTKQPTQPATPAPGQNAEKPARPRPKPGTSLREPLLPALRFSAALRMTQPEAVSGLDRATQERDPA